MEAQIDVRPPGAEGRPLRLALLGDERLARLVAGGSERAFATLYERYHQPLYRYCRSMLRDDADAQDALQSAFSGALVALRRDQRDAPLRPWLYRIAHNEAVSLLRRRRPQDELSETSGLAIASAEDVAEDRARLALLLADLRELPERQRGALVMRELSGLSHEDVALALGISVGAAKQTVFEARRSLGEFSEGRAMPCDEICQTVSDGDGRALRSRKVRAHLRECSGCAAFAAAIPARAADLHALAPPLPAIAAAGLLCRVFAAGSGHGGGGVGAAVVAGKSIGVAITTKTLVGAVLLAGVAGGVAVVLHHSASSVRGPAAAQVGSPAPAPAGGRPGSNGSGRFVAGGHHPGGSATGARHRAGSGGRRSAARRARTAARARARARSARVLAAAQLRRSSRNDVPRGGGGTKHAKQHVAPVHRSEPRDRHGRGHREKPRDRHAKHHDGHHERRAGRDRRVKRHDWRRGHAEHHGRPAG